MVVNMDPNPYQATSAPHAHQASRITWRGVRRWAGWPLVAIGVVMWSVPITAPPLMERWTNDPNSWTESMHVLKRICTAGVFVGAAGWVLVVPDVSDWLVRSLRRMIERLRAKRT